MKDMKRVIGMVALLCAVSLHAWAGEIPNTVPQPPTGDGTTAAAQTEPSGGEIPNTEAGAIAQGITAVLNGIASLLG
jgi:hypothetical protein